MIAKENLEEKLEELGQAISSDDSLVENVMSRIDATPAVESNRTGKFNNKLISRRFIMNRFTKFTAAAAVIIVGAALSITVIDKLTSPAYAIEQTINIVRRDKAGNIEDERWIEIGTDGIQARYRQDTPERNFFVVDDRQTVLVRHPDKNTVVLYDANDKCWTWIYAPGALFQELAKGSPDYYTVKEDVHYKGRPAHHLRWVMGDTDIYIDLESKLPIAFGDYEIDYEDPPEGTFDIVIPDGVILVDKRPGAEPTPEPQWMIEEKRQKEMGKLAQVYFEDARRALAGGDPVRAAELFNKTIEISPGRNWAWLWMGIALYESGDYDAAIYRLSKVIDMTGEHDLTIPSYHFARGLAYQAKGMTDMARLDMEKVLPKMILALRNTKVARSFDLADDPLICADGMREGCHGAPTIEQSLAMMINRLRIITGHNFGYDPDGSSEENEQAIAGWEDWYENSGEIKVTPDAELVRIPKVVEEGVK
ncbi:MAG: tetratricopeptide repeat protein [Planctomycetota bacterium]|jgi:hypothetical protein